MKKLLSLVLSVAMVIGLVPMMSLSSSAAYSGTLKFDSNGEFTIMQLTDIQDNAEVESETLEMITKAVSRYSPDLVVLTGDNIAGGMSESDFQSSVNQFMAPIISAGVPYAVTFGNHDAEDGTLIDTPDRDTQYDYYISLSDYAIDFDVDELSHTGTGVIPIYSNDGSAVKFAVFPIDTGDYDENGDYDHAKTDQVEWYEAKAKELGVPHLVFQHIIVPEVYTTLLTEADSSTSGAVKGGSGEWTDRYWILDPNNSTITGGMYEGPCPSAQNGGQYAAMVRTGTMVGNFVGHDHTNTFVGTTSDGITIGYTQALTMHSYGTHDPAVRVFTVKEDGTYTTKHIALSEMNMAEAEDYEHDTIAGTPTVPSRLVVGASGNGLSQQKLGNVIQQYSVNHALQALYPNDMEITIDLANTVSGVTLTPQSGISVSGVTVTAKDSETNTYTWTITGGTATAGTAAEFRFDYTLADGTTRTQYAYSYVDNIRTPAGYYVFTRNYRGGNNSDNFNDQEYVMTILGSTAYGDARYQTDSVLTGYQGNEVGTWTDATAGYYDYTQEEDAGFVKMGDPDYAMIFTSPARANARTLYYFNRFATAGQSPVSTVFVDTSEMSTIADLNLKVNYYRHSTTDHSLSTLFEVFFKIGDAGYTVTNSVENTASADNLSENTAGSTSINTTASSLTLAAAKGSNAAFSIGGTIPSDGTEYTLISRGYSWWSENYDTPLRTYMPVLLRFTVYDKAEITALVNAERTAMRQTDDSMYRAAFKEAYKQVNKINTTQADINAAVTTLNYAIEALSFEGEDAPVSGEYAGTSTVAPIIYVAGDGYGPNKQPTGTTIVSGVMNYGTAALNTEYSKFTFAVPQGASDASVNVTCSSGGSVTSTWDAGTGVGYVTGGTANPGDYIRYEFTYTLNGQKFIQTEASAVLDAPQPGGWAMYVRRGGTNIRNIVETSVFFGDVGALPAGAYYTGVQGFDGETTSVNFSGSDFSSQRNLGGVGMMVWDSGLASIEDRIYGSDSDVWEDTSNDGGYRAKVSVHLDKSVISDLGGIGMGVRYQSFQSASATGAIKSTSDLYVEDAVFFNGTVNIDYIKNTAAQATDTNEVAISAFTNSTGGTEYPGERDSGSTARYGTKEENDPYLIASLYSANGLPAEGTYTFWTQIVEWNDAWQNQEMFAHALWNISFSYVDKSSLRNFVAEEDEIFRQLSENDYNYYSDDNGKFTAYLTALAKAKAAITDPTMNDTETAAIYTELQTAVMELEYCPADFTELDAKIAQVSQGDGSDRKYRPHPSNDPTYYAKGLYYSQDCFSSYNELDIPINEANSDEIRSLDVRSQYKVDRLVEAIDVGWINVRLVAADYTNVDYYLAFKEGTGENGAAGGAEIKAPDKYDYLKLADPMLPASYYTTASYMAWTDACANGSSDRSLKKPDQDIVDGYAEALATAYNNLTLLTADFSPLDEVEEAVADSLNMTVEVVDPSNAENNYDISYYDPDLIAQIRAKIAERDESLTIVEQDKVTALVNEIDALYAELASTLNDADLTYANEQAAIEATYEAEAAKYYTEDSWNRLVAARAAVSKYTTKETDSQVAVNAAAQEIYDARNALEYNEADYSVVNEYLALIAEAEANKDWYTNWDTVEAAVATVETGLDVTEQEKVDAMAAALKSAYEGLNLKDADYTALYAAITAGNTANADAQYYTTDTYKTFSEALAAANTMYTEGQTTPLKINEQAKIDAVEAALLEAISGLKYQDANIQPVVDAINAYNTTVYDGMYYGEYEDADGDGDEDILDTVKVAYSEAQALVDAYNAGTLTIKDNTTIAVAATNLETLRAALPACYMSIYEALVDPYTGEALYDHATDGKLSAYLTTLDANLKKTYTDDSVNNLINTLKAISYSYKIDDQSLVDEASGSVYEMVALLEYKNADLTDLNEAIAAGDEKVDAAESTDWFTEDTWAEYEEAYNAAVDIRDADPAYLITEQETVDEAAEALAAATQALAYKDADYDALNDAIASAADLNKDDWTDESWADLLEALEAAEAVEEGLKIDSQDEIDAAASNLAEAINSLKSGTLELVGLGDTVIDDERGFIYGLQDGYFDTITDLVAQNYAEVIGNGYLKYTFVGNNAQLGTGAKVELIRGEDDGDDSNNEVVKTYYIVIFGDNNGDSFVTLEDMADYMMWDAFREGEYNHEYEDLNNPYVFACDLNMDGMVMMEDFAIIAMYDAMTLETIDQTYGAK